MKGVIITKYAMAALEAILPANNFLRVHRSFLISINKIDSFTADEIDIRGQPIPVGNFYKQQALEILNDI